MFTCSRCGNQVELDDNWGGATRIRDIDTQLPHRCYVTPRSHSFFRPGQEK